MDLRLPNFDRDRLCHFGGGGSSVPAGAGTSGNPSVIPGASVYVPQAQPQFDAQFQNVIAGFPTTAAATPAGAAYPQAQDIYSRFLMPGFDAFNAYTDAQQAANYHGIPAAQGLSAEQALAYAGNQILDTAQDPRQALYARTLNQLQQQLGVQAANSGLTGTPYAGGIASDALRNFNIDWQNQQLQRQLQGAAGAGNAFSQGLNLGVSGLNAGAQLGALPYQALTTQGSNALQGLGSLTNLGNQQYVLPQQVLNDLQSYLGLGQAASQISGNLGNLGLQQQGNALSGIGSAIGLGNTLLGNPLSGVGSSIGSALGLGSGLGAGLGAFDAGSTLGVGALDAASQLGPGIGASVGSGSIFDAIPSLFGGLF